MSDKTDEWDWKHGAVKPKLSGLIAEECAALRAQNARLRRALEEIAGFAMASSELGYVCDARAVHVARAALKGEDE